MTIIGDIVGDPWDRISPDLARKAKEQGKGKKSKDTKKKPTL